MEKIKTREEKYKALREEISKMNDNGFESSYTLTKEETQELIMDNISLEEGHKKRETLSIPLERLMDAHEHYESQMEEKKKENKNHKNRSSALKIIIGVSVFALIIVAIIIILFILL